VIRILFTRFGPRLRCKPDYANSSLALVKRNGSDGLREAEPALADRSKAAD
jgi:hypothetical protein